MARSLASSPSLSPRSASPAFSSSPSSSAAELEDDSAPATSSSEINNDKSAKNAEPDAVTCLWDDCGVIFTHLPTLIKHIHDDHIGVHKSNYTCEWATCTRRGLAQTSRFALISHIRSHTGEKPFTCPRPECDKSFTRSDALAKHMRLQHGIEPPLPGRGGNRKRKRNHHYNANFAGFGAGEAEAAPNANTSEQGGGGMGFSTFKVESSTPVEFYIEEGDGRRVISPIEHVRVDYFGGAPPPAPAPRAPAPTIPSSASPHANMPPSAASSLSSDSEDGENDLERERGEGVGGRGKAMVRYLRTKAKHRYALQEHEGLLEELRIARVELAREREEKERVLDEFLRTGFGPAADPLIVRIPQPESRRRRAAMK